MPAIESETAYYGLKIGDRPIPLIFEDRQIGRPTKAKNADVVLLYTSQTFVDFPDYYVSGLDFSEPKKITEANPQQGKYPWGKRILVDYKNSKGVKLQATLTLLAGYHTETRYPMLVYFCPGEGHHLQERENQKDFQIRMKQFSAIT